MAIKGTIQWYRVSLVHMTNAKKTYALFPEPLNQLYEYIIKSYNQYTTK